MDKIIELKHGNGGPNMQKLVSALTSELANDIDAQVDAFRFAQSSQGDWLTSTDGFSVDPLFFPGGSIGSLAVNGTVNDLSVAGAVPKFLTLNLFIEEGTQWSLLQQIMRDCGRAATEANVQIIAGDTKVMPKQQIPTVLMATTGLGLKNNSRLISLTHIQPGDSILVSGTLGDHGASVMLARQDYELHGELRSCCAPVTSLTQSAMEFDGLRFMRDPTRGGLTTVLHDMAQVSGWCPKIKSERLPIRPEVQSLCDLLGFDPLTLASEGRVLAVIEASQADALKAAWRKLPNGRDAEIIGAVQSIRDDPVLETELGGEKYLSALLDDPLPRIC